LILLVVAIGRCCCGLVVNFGLNGALVNTSFDMVDWLFGLVLLIPGGYDSECGIFCFNAPKL
jgi:hypothetical protein